MEQKDNWFKKHVDTIIILGGILTSVIWMNYSINCVRYEINDLKTEMAVMKTVLIMKDIMPRELVKVENRDK
jgi:hypothetical protein